MPKNCPLGKEEEYACRYCLCYYGDSCTYYQQQEARKDREKAKEYFKNRFIDDLNLALKHNFDFVPIEKVLKIAEDLFKKDWIKNV